MCLDATTPPEEWRSVVGYEGIYEVSNLGRVRRSQASKNSPANFIKSPRLNAQTGYFAVDLKAAGLKKRTVGVHSLVAEAFHGRRVKGVEVNHRDGVKTHNCATNLEWATDAENSRHAFRLGLVKRQKVTRTMADQITAAKGKMTYGAIAERFSISRATVWRVLAKRGIIPD